MSNVRFDIAKRLFRQALKHTKDPTVREWLKEGLEQLDMGIYIDEKRIEEAKMIGVRNPSFDGDYIGYPDDDL